MFPKPVKLKRRKRGGPIPKKVKDEVWHRDGGLCQIRLLGCGVEAVDPSHIKPKGRGGSNTARNILCACRKCHEWLESEQYGCERFRTHAHVPEGLNYYREPVWINGVLNRGQFDMDKVEIRYFKDEDGITYAEGVML